MKTWKVILNILLGLAAIAGIVYIVATYGDRIAAWARTLLNKCKCGCGCKKDGECTCGDECTCCEECTCGEECTCDCAEGEVIAEQADFEG